MEKVFRMFFAPIFLTSILFGASGNAFAQKNVAFEVVEFDVYQLAQKPDTALQIKLKSNKDCQKFCKKFAMREGTCQNMNFDFVGYDYILVYGGMKPNGGYAVAIDKIVQGEKNIAVNYFNTKSGPSCNVTEMISYPSQMVRIAKIKQKIKFKKMPERLTKC